MVDRNPEIRIYGLIGLDITSQQVASQLDALGSHSDVTVRINSKGGDVFEGVGILNVLRGHQGNVTTVVDGVAASAASFIAMGGNEIVMNRNSEMMIHLGHAQIAGGMDDLRKVADNLERINANMASIYAEKAGGTADQWLTIMAAETWFSADEAVKAGLADRVETAAPSDGATIAASVDLSTFQYAGRAHAPAPQIPQAHNETPPIPEAEKGKEPPVATLSESALQKLGLDADADESAIEAAIDAAIAEPEEQAPPAEPTLEQATQIAAKAGLATITTEALSALQAQAQSGAEARAQQVREADERIVDQAIVEGKVAPARRDHHLQALAADRDGHTAVLAALAPGLIPLAEQGHGVTTEVKNEDDAVYTALFGTGV